jgi:hypothetical protein
MHIFIPFKFGFHKIDYKRVQFSLFNFKKLYTKLGYQYFYLDLASSHGADSHKPIITFFQVKNKIIYI